MYGEDYAGYIIVILSFLAFRFCSAYFIYMVSCTQLYAYQSDCIQNLLNWILEKEEGLFSLLVVPWAGYNANDFEN
jgi:hypothetical protein